MYYSLLAMAACLVLGSGCVSATDNTSPSAGLSPQTAATPSPETSPVIDVEARYDEASPGAEIFKLSFKIPEGMNVEFIPEIEALNIYSEEGEGTTLDRSQIFVRYFDANRFLTLQTVQIYSTLDLTVGAESYVARRYDVEKLPGITNFPSQPDWRNERHVVTDFRGEEGFTRYYVVAGSPELDMAIYESVLQSMAVSD